MSIVVVSLVLFRIKLHEIVLRRLFAPRRLGSHFIHCFGSGKDPYAALKKQTAAATQDAVNAGVKLVSAEMNT